MLCGTREEPWEKWMQGSESKELTDLKTCHDYKTGKHKEYPARNL